MELSEFQLALDRGRRDFPWVSLEGQCLRKLSLVGLSLRQAKLDRADLSETDCSGATLLKVSATESQWRAARLDRVNAQKANFSRASFVNAQLSAAQLQGADLSAADFRQANLRGANLTGAILTGACFAAADLTDAIFDWDSEPIAQGDFTAATMPDGQPFSADWQPGPVDPLPKVQPATDRAIDSVQSNPVDRAVSGAIESTDAPTNAPPPDRPHRYLMSNPSFAVPNAGPPPPPPRPGNLWEAGQRLPWPLLTLWLLGYALWGSSLAVLDPPPQSWLLLALSSLAGMAGLQWGFLALTGGAMAIVLAVPLPQQVLSILLGGATGLTVGLLTKFLMHISWVGALRNALLALASAVTVINLTLGFVWLGMLGALAFTFSAMPLWTIMVEQNLSPTQRLLVMAGVSTLGVAIGRWVA
ncbi:MAG: pentapeptide repeat-containing protein [Limnothrix sp. CACIAM 69d]|nr:MAG: pentapeptide repeat-containing protein [Limnothrix sp. CACIAM 69d]